MSKHLNRRGYIIPKSQLTEEELTTIRTELTVTPIVSANLPIQCRPPSFKIYNENMKKIYVPRYYGLQHYGEIEEIAHNAFKAMTFEPINLYFVKQLRAEQLQVVDCFLQRMDRTGGGILQLPCGFGKTILTLYLISQIGIPTLIVVHKEFLMNQWKERIGEFLPTARIGSIQGPTIDIEGKDIVIGMLQSISMKDYDSSVFERFGFAVIDECHHLGAEMFSKALPKIATKYMLGLSATPNRKDGLRCVFEWYLGPVLYEVNRKVAQTVELDKLYYNDPHASERLPYYQENNTYRIRLITSLVESDTRTQTIVNKVMEILNRSDAVVEEAQQGRRQILILSDRRQHLVAINGLLQQQGVRCGYYWGGEKQKNLDKAQSATVILGTFNMASEGMDIPTLNALILASPKTDIKQAIGRIFRKQHEIVPVIVDVVDVDYPCFMRQYYIRNRVYKQLGFFDEQADELSTEPGSMNSVCSEDASTINFDDFLMTTDD